MDNQPDIRKYFHWNKSALLDECIKQAYQLSEIRKWASRILQAHEMSSVDWEAMSELQKLLNKEESSE